jgi:hypothetical protein
METTGIPDYQVLETPTLLLENRHDGNRIIQQMVAHLDSGAVIVLDCKHPVGRDHRGKFHLIQLETLMFVVVCDHCTSFALMGEVIEGGGAPYRSGKV